MKKLAWLIGLAGMLGSAGYLFTYLVRWQWNRALFSGFALLAVIVVMGFAWVVQRLDRIEQSLDRAREPSGQSGMDAAFLADLQQTRPRRDHFAWLREQQEQMNVFITVLLGGGAVVSAVAWIVGRVAESTTTPSAEEGLAERMGPLAYPDGGLVPGEQPVPDDASSLLRGRPTGVGRR
ncbi:hypothetical protein DVS28_a0819 [Euzebya pacifica]|uniref:Uncharacterized protein n=1 Tax=Euzebya pacifica TaxID=1608957 RepID=A0A346XTH3_9ACTN|nr:hypothetical protein [Euzebya pacifica]AXV05520.1 hypothetical protein DVS28_a0819 [Euzebya pacifica]